MDVSEAASISAGIAGRYAQAVFDIATEEGTLPAAEADLEALEAALAESSDFRDFIASPLIGREEMGAAMAAIAERMGLSRVMRNTLGLMAQKRRLFVLPQFVAALRALIARSRGEITAEVVSAQPLSPEQERRLAATLSEAEGRTVRLRTRTDPSLIGGLVVRLGSRMIDTSVRTKLGRIGNMMKEVG